MNRFPFRIVGFDLDGTLLDTSADLGAAVNHALDLSGRPPVTTDKVRNLIGGGARKMLERALKLTGGVPEEEFEPLYRELISFYENNIAVHTRLYPGGEAMLDALAANDVQVAVVTNKLESLAVKVIDELGLTSRFFTIIGGDTLGPGRNKPSRHPIDEMIARAGGTGRAAFVGDTTYDIKAARAAEVPCVAVSFGYPDLPPEELGADTVIGHFDELVPALQML